VSGVAKTEKVTIESMSMEWASRRLRDMVVFFNLKCPTLIK
jgi:hypothetical protein